MQQGMQATIMNATRRYSISPGDPGGYYINDRFQSEDDIHPMAVCCDLKAANDIVTALNEVHDLNQNILQPGTVWKRLDGIARVVVSVDEKFVHYSRWPTDRLHGDTVTRMHADKFIRWMSKATLVRIGHPVRRR